MTFSRMSIKLCLMTGVCEIFTPGTDARGGCETGHVPLLYRTYPGNGSDQAVLAACLGGLAHLHEALDSGEARARPAQRTLVRDGGFWSPQLELDLDTAGYYSLISLPLGHKAAGRGVADGGAARCHETALGQAQRSPGGAHSDYRRRVGSHARCGGEPRIAGGPETRDRGGPAQSEGGTAHAGGADPKGPHLA